MSDKSDVAPALIMKRVEAASGARYSAHKEKPREFVPIAPVGTSYTPIGRVDMSELRKGAQDDVIAPVVNIIFRYEVVHKSDDINEILGNKLYSREARIGEYSSDTRSPCSVCPEAGFCQTCDTSLGGRQLVCCASSASAPVCSPSAASYNKPTDCR
jgi:hypothetical protein